MVVPTMLGRILDVIEADGEGLPTLRALSYGGGPMPVPVIERAMALLPDVGFVNAYGLTETSSHDRPARPRRPPRGLRQRRPRGAGAGSARSAGRCRRSRCRSATRSATSCPPASRARSGCGASRCRASTSAATAARRRAGSTPATPASLDDDGFLFVHGRLDDVIVRGGENLSPGEIEDVLLEHPAVAEAAVVGVPDTEWGEKVVAAVVLHDGADGRRRPSCRTCVRAKLRSTRTPEHIDFRDELPYNETGKLLRRVLKTELADEAST